MLLSPACKQYCLMQAERSPQEFPQQCQECWQEETHTLLTGPCCHLNLKGTCCHCSFSFAIDCQGSSWDSGTSVSPCWSLPGTLTGMATCWSPFPAWPICTEWLQGADRSLRSSGAKRRHTARLSVCSAQCRGMPVAPAGWIDGVYTLALACTCVDGMYTFAPHLSCAITSCKTKRSRHNSQTSSCSS